MTIFFNNEPLNLPKEILTVEDLLKWKDIKHQGTAVAINEKLLRKDQWGITQLQDLMNVSVITAAFGG